MSAPLNGPENLRTPHCSVEQLDLDEDTRRGLTEIVSTRAGMNAKDITLSATAWQFNGDSSAPDIAMGVSGLMGKIVKSNPAYFNFLASKLTLGTTEGEELHIVVNGGVRMNPHVISGLQQALVAETNELLAQLQAPTLPY